jgi:hypothetical protein
MIRSFGDALKNGASWEERKNAGEKERGSYKIQRIYADLFSLIRGCLFFFWLSFGAGTDEASLRWISADRVNPRWASAFVGRLSCQAERREERKELVLVDSVLESFR